nr:hypothetical protein Q903MT_gene2906 [Picea sitchensis]
MEIDPDKMTMDPELKGVLPVSMCPLASMG